MPFELGFQVRYPRLEPLLLIQEGEHDGPDGKGSRLPVRRWNAEGRRKLAHGASMNQECRIVKPLSRLVWSAYKGA